MTTTRSPFMVFQNFLSPKQCEQITSQLDFFYPDVDTNGIPIKSIKMHDKCEDVVFERLQSITNEICTYYNIEYKGTGRIIFEWFPTKSTGEPTCENSEYIGRKWTRTNRHDVSGILFFSDYNEDQQFDQSYEVYGGKLEFPTHDFGFQPQRGTLIIYPGDPHFINVTTTVEIGDLIQARIHISANKPFLYQPELFPGTYKEWFKNLS